MIYSNYSYLIIVICLHTVFLSNTNNLQGVFSFK